MAHPIDNFVAQKIRTARLMRGLTQSALADHIGCSFQQLQKYEAGQNRVSASRLYEISQALDVAPGYFFDGIENDDETKEIDTTASRILFALAKIEDPTVKETLCRLAQSIAQTSDDAVSHADHSE
ncbi:hypothetical protein BVC71_14505 [Marivivens niveibacter]|uniref:HTH cro/C1-type domain-containing protein n=1 Tax=Marivivens niveibacter TaxID=1930667 RepID=A0A251WV02_9RHOB|nr:helix-turn-helix domain-containing protein [Marivivens niveibacter]OUD08176.1 hypothetical protein BVC71_14505 [Marivivens niveibacter]